MKTKEVHKTETIYVCEVCGNSDTNKYRIEYCEKTHKQEECAHIKCTYSLYCYQRVHNQDQHIQKVCKECGAYSNYYLNVYDTKQYKEFNKILEPSLKMAIHELRLKSSYSK